MRQVKGPWYAYVETYALWLGKLQGNLLGLEFLLRAFLFDVERALRMPDLLSLMVGDRVDENAFTNYDTLRKLIRKYNARVGQSAPQLRIDESLAVLRDALAHGRLFAREAEGPFRLLKFAKPKRKMIEVTFAETMTTEWLADQVERTRQAGARVQDAHQQLREQGLQLKSPA